MDQERLATIPARKDEMLEAQLPDSLILYDLTLSQAHDLQPIAAFVWKSCDGKTTVADITRLVEDKYGIEHGEEVVEFILEQFREKNLLKGVLDQPKNYSSISRRDMVMKYIPAAMIVPLIMSATAPTTAQLVSGGTRDLSVPAPPLPGDIAEVHCEGGNLPRFVFSGSSLTLLLVSRRRKRRKNPSETEEATDVHSADSTQWLIEGTHDANVPITYGVVPDGMNGVVPAKLLAEDELYFIHTRIHSEEESLSAGQYFRIQNGKVVEVH